MKKISVISRGAVLSLCVEPLSHMMTVGLTSHGQAQQRCTELDVRDRDRLMWVGLLFLLTGLQHSASILPSANTRVAF